MLIVRLHIADFQRDGRPDLLVWRDWLGDRLVLDNGVYVFLDPCPADPRRHGAMLPINALPVKKGFPAFVRGSPYCTCQSTVGSLPDCQTFRLAVNIG